MIGRDRGLFILSVQSGIGKSNVLSELLLGWVFFFLNHNISPNFSDHALSGHRAVLLSQEMAGSDVYHSVVHQLAESAHTMTTPEAQEYCQIFDKLPFYIREKGEMWNLDNLMAFFNEEIDLEAKVIGIDHQRLVSG